MAFARKSAPAETSSNVTPFEKAKAFLNVEVEMEGGKWVQIEGAALKASKALHQAIIDNGGIDGLNIRVTYNPVVEKTSADFVFAKAQ